MATANLERLKLAELRAISESNGLDSNGVTRAQLISGIRAIEQTATDEESDRDPGQPEIIDEDAEEDVSDDEINLSPELRRLQIQLKLERERLNIDKMRLEVERERLSLIGFDESRSSGVVVNAPPCDIKSLVPHMQNDDAITHFEAFERVMRLNDVDEAFWAKIIVPTLSHKGTRVFSKLSIDDCRNYKVIKERVLEAFKCSPQLYYERFQTAVRSGQESYAQFSNRLNELLKGYLEAKRINDFDVLVNDLVYTRFMSSLNRVPEVFKFVLERHPGNLRDACNYADLFYDVKMKTANNNVANTSDRGQSSQARGSGNIRGYSNQSNSFNGRDQMHRFGGSNSFSENSGGGRGFTPNYGQNQGPRLGSGVSRLPSCHSCGSFSHTTSQHKGPAAQGPSHTNLIESKEQCDANEYIVPTVINGYEVSAVRDSGSDCCVVDESLVNVADYTGRTITLFPAFGPSIVANIANVKLFCPPLGANETIIVPMAVVKNLKRVLLGNDIFKNFKQFTDVITRPSNLQNEAIEKQIVEDKDARFSDLGQFDDKEQTLYARAESRRAAIETCRQFTSGAVTETVKSNTDTINEHRVADKTESHCAQVVTRAQNRVQVSKKSSHESSRGRPRDDSTLDDEWLRLRTIEHNYDANVVDDVGFQSTEFKTAQRADDSLKHWWSLYKSGDVRFVVYDGILYRTAQSWKLDSRQRLLVLPKQYYNEVLRTAHDHVTGAHVGIRKTIERISNVYAFPGLSKRVRDYIKSCDICQRVSNKCVNERFPLTPIEIVGEPFDELVIDVLGKLPKSKGGFSYAFVIVDHATRFVHAEALRNLKVSTIVECLNKFFLTHGFPKTLRCDKYSSFTSGMMKSLQETLNIHVRFAQVGHHEGIGLAERAIQSLSKMIKSFIEDNEKDWDKLLKYFCLAINDTVNATTHFSPSYLVYGRKWRGLLDVMRGAWTKDDVNIPDTRTPVYLYIEQLKERLLTAHTAAREYAAIEQERWKSQYDKHATERYFEENDLVLIHRPTSSHKILSKLDGPYTVVKKIDTWNYIVDLGHRKTSFHVNSLRKYNRRVLNQTEQAASVNAVITLDPDETGQEYDIPAPRMSREKPRVKYGPAAI